MSGEILICFSCFTKKFLLYNTFSSVNICKHKKIPQNLSFTALVKQGKRGSNPHLRFWRPLLYH